MVPPVIKPAADFGVAAAKVGTVGWLLAAVLGWLNWDWLGAHEARWLLGTACAGAVIGIIELGIFTRRRQVYQVLE